MKREVMTIITKRKITDKQWRLILDNIIDVLDKNLLTSGVRPITAKQHSKIWGIANEL